jgi:DNA processing protein
MLGMTPDIVAGALDLYLSGRSGDPGSEEQRLIAGLEERKIGTEALATTTARVRDHQDRGVEVITYWDPKYPGNLRLMPDPPLILYVDGQSFPGREHVAILGTGHPSKAGLDLAYEYGARIARRGRTVVSGLTRGIDAHALEGALAAGGGPIAILGTSLSEIDSHDKRVLAAEVAGSGAAVSELTEEAYPHPGRFQRRNHMIAGMAGSLIVIESPGAGALSRLVELTLKQGRRAYVVQQARFEDPEHEIGFRALRDLGAVPITTADEMIAQEARQGRLF